MSLRFPASQMTEDGKAILDPEGRVPRPKDVELFWQLDDAAFRLELVEGPYFGDLVNECYPIELRLSLDKLYQSLHAQHTVYEPLLWFANDWEMLFEDDLIARKRYESTETIDLCVEPEELGICAPAEVTEETVFELIHSPGS